MPDPFARVAPGQPTRPVSATLWNAMIDSARAFRDGRPGVGRAIPQIRSSTLIRIQNNTGSNLDRNSVVGLDGPVFTPQDSLDAFLRDIIFSGVVPTLPIYAGQFAITLDPVAIGAVARAWVSGVCQVQVDLIETGDAYADITDSDTTQLSSGASGAAEILWCEADEGGSYGYTTGTQWAIVRLGNYTPAVATYLTTSIIPKATGTPWTPGSGSANQVEWDSGSSTWNTIQTGVTLWNITEKAGASGAYVLGSPGDDGRIWAMVPAKCADWT